MMSEAQEITLLLQRSREEPELLNEVYRLVNDRLRRIATACMGNSAGVQSIQETMLVNDAFLQLTKTDQWSGREQFFCMAARVMRQKLVDHSRAKLAQKRGGGVNTVSLCDEPLFPDPKTTTPDQIIELDEVLEQLELEYPDAFQVFSLHYFMGWTLAEIAESILDIPYITIRRRWNLAKLLLRKALSESSQSEDDQLRSKS